MKNPDLYITPYGKPKKQKTSQLIYFLLSFFFGLGITTALLCVLALILQGR